MSDKAYIKGLETSLEFAGIYHDIKSKVALSVKLTSKERSFYLLFIASLKEAKEYLKNEKESK